MSVKKLHTNYDAFYYITFTCLRWISLFEITGFYDFLQLMFDSVPPSERQRNKKHEVFQDSLDCKEAITEKFVRQKLNYIHKNPVSGKWKLVDHYLDYEYSSARFYNLGEEPKCKLFHYAELISSAESPR